MFELSSLRLKDILKANAASCLIFGCIFVFIPSQVLSFLSENQPAPKWILITLGVGLILNGFHLLWASLRQIHNKNLITYFIVGDFLWVIASAVLVIFGVWITAVNGIITTSIVALMVGIFGFLQYKHLRNL